MPAGKLSIGQVWVIQERLIGSSWIGLKKNGHVIFTHDLDFGTLLALTHKSGPSVLQVRGDNVLPDHLGNLVVTAIHQHESDLVSGALVVIEERKNRVRVLPI